MKRHLWMFSFRSQVWLTHKEVVMVKALVRYNVPLFKLIRTSICL